MVCSGNGLEYCGGPSILQVWNNTQYTGKISTGPPTPGVSTLQLPSTGSALYQGCYAEGVGSRALNGTSFANSLSMTLELCAAFCQKGQYSLFGLEYYDVRTTRPTPDMTSDQIRNVTAQLIPSPQPRSAKGIVLTTVWETAQSSVAQVRSSVSGASTTPITSLRARPLQLDQLQRQPALEPPFHHLQSR